MREAFDIAGVGILYAGLFGLAALALIGLGMLLADVWQIVRERVGKSKVSQAVAAIAAAGAIMYGGSKGIVQVSDPYIRDNGSFVTNDYVHVAVVKRFDFIPDSMEVLIYSREVDLTNATDWVKLVRAEEGPFRLAEFPLDIPFPNATNYNFLVAANYIPEPTVHTNGVWSIKGFIVPAATARWLSRTQKQFLRRINETTAHNHHDGRCLCDQLRR